MEPTNTYRQLTERQYLGVGYVHQFKNNTTGEARFVPCLEEEYTRMGLPEGSQHNPVLAGHTWECSLGGTTKVNTPNTLLGKDEYCFVGREIKARLVDINGIDSAWVDLPRTAVNAGHQLDEASVENLGYGNRV